MPRRALVAAFLWASLAAFARAETGAERPGAAPPPGPAAPPSLAATDPPASDGADADADTRAASDAAAAASDLDALLRLDHAALERLLVDAPDKVGSLSLGAPDAGALVFPVQMPASERWQLVKARQSWGTRETVEFVAAAIDAVHRQFPGTPPLHVGDISKERGGYFPPHTNHQNGRDVDLGFYYKEPTLWYRRAYRSNLDVPRTWALLRALVTETDVELIYCDAFVLALVRAHARAIGEDEAWLQRVFVDPSPTYPRPLVRHEDGHRTHIHVRFHNRRAQRLGRRLLPLLEKHGLVRHPLVFTEHLVKPGQSLESVVRRYRSSKHAIREHNALGDGGLEVGKTYVVPHERRLEPDDTPVEVPPRLLPPRPEAAPAPPPPPTPPPAPTPMLTPPPPAGD